MWHCRCLCTQAVVKLNGMALQYAGARLKDDRDVVLVAVAQAHTTNHARTPARTHAHTHVQTTLHRTLPRCSLQVRGSSVTYSSWMLSGGLLIISSKPWCWSTKFPKAVTNVIGVAMLGGRWLFAWR